MEHVFLEGRLVGKCSAAHVALERLLDGGLTLLSLWHFRQEPHFALLPPSATPLRTRNSPHERPSDMIRKQVFRLERHQAHVAHELLDAHVLHHVQHRIPAPAMSAQAELARVVLTYVGCPIVVPQCLPVGARVRAHAAQVRLRPRT